MCRSIPYKPLYLKNKQVKRSAHINDECSSATILEKMLRQMGVAMSSFEIRFLKELATSNTPHFPQKTKLKAGWIIFDLD